MRHGHSFERVQRQIAIGLQPRFKTPLKLKGVVVGLAELCGVDQEFLSLLEGH